jgi:hypothetical protein
MTIATEMADAASADATQVSVADVDATTASVGAESGTKRKPGKAGSKKASASKPKRNRSKAGEPKRKPGRPPRLLEDERTLQLIRSLARIQCTHADAADCLGASRQAFAQFLARSEKAAEAWDRGTGEGRMSLRRLQWQTAQKSAVMQIWLGKHWLGQTDRMERSDKLDANISSVSVAVLKTPDLQSVPDRRAALFRFEQFRRDLAQTTPALPAPAAAA